MSRRGLSFLYGTLPPALFILALVVAMLVATQFLVRYDVRVIRRANLEKQVKFARTPVISLQRERFAVLGINYHYDHLRRSVIVRNLRTNQIMSAGKGQRLFGGPVVRHIDLQNLTFAVGPKVVMVALPIEKSQRSRFWPL